MLGYDLTDPALFDNGFPHRVFSGIRRDRPVAWHDPSERRGVTDGFWSVAAHADVVTVLAATEILSPAPESVVDDAVALSLVELARRPDLVALARSAAPTYTALLFAELARWVCPQIVVWCRAGDELVLGSHRIGPGERLACWLPSANRDESVFGRDAMDLVPGRSVNPHLTFCRLPDGSDRFTSALGQVLGEAGELVLTGEPEYVRSADHTTLRSLPVELVTP